MPDFKDFLPQPPWQGLPIPRFLTSKPTTSYLHGLYDIKDMSLIISEGLRVNSSVSSARGQATGYPIMLEFDKLQVNPVSYRPGDFITTARSGKPTTIYVVPEDFGKGVRPIDEINKELSSILGRLEASGIATPEEIGAIMGEHKSKAYNMLSKLDPRLAKVHLEMEDYIKIGHTVASGEERVKEVCSRSGDIPVYVLSRDEEGDIDWSTKRLV